MGAKFFSQRTPGRGADAGDRVQASGIGLEHQQALVLGALRRAEGAPVSYAELREAGVELPASVVSELELAGVAIERCSGDGGAVGVRLDPDDDPGRPATPRLARAWPADLVPPATLNAMPPRAPNLVPPRTADSAPVSMPQPAVRTRSADAAREPEWGDVRRYRASSLEAFFLTVLAWLAWPIRKSDRTEPRSGTRRRRPADPRPGVSTGTPGVRVRVNRVIDTRKRRILPVAALLAGVALVFVLGAMWVVGGDRGTRAPIAKRPHPRVVVTTSAARPAPAAASTHPSAPPPRVPVSPALATNLEAQGHSLMEAGRYDAAVPVLKRAVLATGETLGGCIEPANSTCLTYAYALYDLGRATRLSGEPQAAVPILERRLHIDNQRGVVSDELQLARQGIG